MIIIATELHVKSFWKLFLFIRHLIRSMMEARAAFIPGEGQELAYRLYPDGLGEPEAMLQFRNSGPNKKAMQQVAKLSYCYKTRIWEAPAIPA
jgi:hypothetical protein